MRIFCWYTGIAGNKFIWVRFRYLSLYILSWLIDTCYNITTLISFSWILVYIYIFNTETNWIGFGGFFVF